MGAATSGNTLASILKMPAYSHNDLFRYVRMKKVGSFIHIPDELEPDELALEIPSS
jgi:hypothetical protein